VPLAARFANADHPFYVEVGERIRSARQEGGLTQDALAEAVNLTRTSIGNIESGRQRPLLHTVAAIARALKRDVVALLPAPDEAREAHADTVASAGPSTMSPPDDRTCG